MADKTSIWFQRSGVLQIKNLSITGNFKHKGNLILWNKPSKRQKTADITVIEHSEVRSVNIPQIVKILCHYYNIGEDEALKRFYESATGANFADEETGLYGQSALHIAGLFIVEQDGEIDHSRL